MMRTFTIAVLVASSVFLGACATKPRPLVAPPVPPKTLEAEEATRARIEALKVAEIRRVAELSLEERAIYIRAQEIEREEALARARKERAKYESPAMKKARAEVMAKKVAEARRLEDLRNAKLEGCDPSTGVWIHPDLVYTRWAALASAVQVRVFNPAGGVAVDIFDPSHGLVVRGLLPGCSIKIFRSAILLRGEHASFQFTASGVVNGKTVLDQSRSYSFSGSSRNRMRPEDEWVIRLRIVDPVTPRR